MKVERLRSYNKLFAVAISATAYAFALSGGNFDVLVPFQAIVILMPGLILLASGYTDFDNRNLLRWATISTIVPLTVLANIQNYPSTVTTVEFAVSHAVGIVGLLFALQWAATNLSPETLMRHLAICLFPLIALAVAVALHDAGWLLRANPFGLHPNWWGELAFAATASALALRNRNARSLVIGTALILFILVQSRGALLAAFVSVVMYMLLSARLTKMSRARLIAALTMLMLAVVGFVLAQGAVSRALAFFSDAVLLLDNPDRGLDTGLTGRLAGWRVAIDVAADNPLLGQGLDTLTKVHNGFLQLLGEGGVLLFLVILLIMVIAIYDASRRHNYLALSIIFGYAVYAMTYPRMLNMNVASILFYMCLFSWQRTSKFRIQRSSQWMARH
jgi:O-antigen ligase